MADVTLQPQTDPWFEGAVASVPSDPDPLFAELRATAAESLPGLTFPRRKDEAWRRCDLTSLRASRIVAPSGGDASALLATCHDLEDSAGMRLVLVDGVCCPELSDLSALPEGVTAGSLCNAQGDARDGALAALRQPLPEAGADHRTALGVHAFAALNHASLADVVCVHVPAGMAIEEALHVVMISTAAASDAPPTEGPPKAALAASHPNMVISLGEGASLSLLQQYGGADGTFINGLTRSLLGTGSSLLHSYVQEQASEAVHVDSVLVEVGERARYENQLLMSGGRIARVNLRVSLDGPGAHSELRGLTLAAGKQLADVHSRVVHASGDCTSQQEQRNAVAGSSRVVFKGAVVVPTGADNTTANQLCRTLLLSDDARIDVQPTLEIDTDDVQCTHGATVSDLDDEMIFYLQARGLSRLDARSLLLEGWARSALDKVPAAGARQRAAVKASTLAPDKPVQVRQDRLSSI